MEEPDSTSARASSSDGASSWSDTSNSSSGSSGSGSSGGVFGVGLRKGGLVVGPMSRCVLAQYLLPPLLRGLEAHGHPPSSSTSVTTTTTTTATDGVYIDRWGYLSQALQDACVRLQQQQQQQQQPQSFSASSSASTPGPGSGASPNPYGYRSLALVTHAEQRSGYGGATGTEATALALLCCRWLQVIKNHSPTALLLSLINI